MFQIKICGVTNLEDAITAADAGADAIGLNFYTKSSRYIDPSNARQLVSDLDGLAECWGVFVNAAPNDLALVFCEAQLDGVQLHGDESPEDVAAAATRLRSYFDASDLALMRARRLSDRGLAEIGDDLHACRDAGVEPSAMLLDAVASGHYGGTGKTLPWESLADYRQALGDTPLILAGGLTPDNVAEAIRIVRPHGVDVASGVESAPGKKDPHKIRDFIAAARTALDALPS